MWKLGYWQLCYRVPKTLGSEVRFTTDTDIITRQQLASTVSELISNQSPLSTTQSIT